MYSAVRLGLDVLRDLSKAREVEWLQADGLGGFAMGTAAGMNTRRYHGWCVSLRPPVERHVLLSRLEEDVGGVELAVNQYPGAVHPRGHERLVAFESSPCPKWTWDLGGGLTVSKRLWLVRGARTLRVRYEASRPCTMRVRPLVAWRDYHSLQRGGGELDRRWAETVRFTHGGRRSSEGEGWYWNTEYEVERLRGLDFKEDLWCLGTVTLELAPSAELTFSLGEPVLREPEAASPAELFRVRRADGRPTIIAGYPWFTDWGRDTMISLPGLLGGKAEAREVIQAFVQHLDQGLMPNRFPDRGERPEYNTADATLWAFEAVQGLQTDRSFFFEAAREIVAWHERGTHFGIHVDPADGLVVNGPQTTWMDAVVDGRAITPRAGKAVEINALWFNALKLMEQWGLGPQYGEKAERVRRSIAQTFSGGRSGLRDLEGDAACRPNQLFAVSLTHSPLGSAEQQAVVRACEEKLLTPFGLRTLAQGEAGYVGRYDGGPVQRDGAYHQGTVWPWLIGPYVAAHLRAFGRPPDASVLRPLRELLERNGTLPEVFDGDAPHRPGGTPAQAWSVAEVLRASALCR